MNSATNNTKSTKSKSTKIEFVWVACTGEAHSNPHIDNCGVCVNHRWGFIARPASDSQARFDALTPTSRKLRTTRFVNAYHKAVYEAQFEGLSR